MLLLDPSTVPKAKTTNDVKVKEKAKSKFGQVEVSILRQMYLPCGTHFPDERAFRKR